MDEALPYCTKDTCTNNNNLPRQQKHDPTMRKWQDVK